MVVGSRLYAFILLLTLLAVSIHAETVTMAASGGRVRFTAPGDVVRMQVEVYASSGQSLFDATIKGNVFDWLVQDGAGLRLGDGSYLCVVTVKNLGGKLAQRAGTLAVFGDEVQLKRAELSTAQRQAVGPLEENAFIVVDEPIAATVVAHDGNDGQVVATAGALTFRTGDVFAGTDKEQMRITPEGRVGIGTAKPETALDVAGAVRSTEGFEFADGTRIEANNGKLTIKDAEGRPAAANVASNASGAGTQNRVAKWIDGAGALGDAAAYETGGLTFFGQNHFGAVEPLFAWAPAAHVVEIGATGTRSPLTLAGGSGVMEFWKDLGQGIAAPSAALAFGLASPGAPATNDMIFSTYIDGGGWRERMRVTNDGRVGIGTVGPGAKLHVAGDIRGNALLFPDGTSVSAVNNSVFTPGGFLATGALSTGPIPASGPGVRMMWYPGKAAFRAGVIDSEAGVEWNDANVGHGSWAGGRNTKAYGNNSFAFGENAVTQWDWSLAIGRNVQAINNHATFVLGSDSIARGSVSFAFGHEVEAAGFDSFAFGYGAKTLHNGSFIWTDNLVGTFASTDEGQFLIRARNGVGIFTNEPRSRLEIKGGANADGSGFQNTMSFAWNSGGYRHFVRTRHNASGGAGNAIDFFVNNSTDAAASTAPGTGNQFVMTLNDGKMGVGTTGPSYKLHVHDAGNTGLRVQTDTAGGTVASFASNGVFEVDAPFIPGGRFRIKEDGKVGIGTNDPQEKLHVLGIVRVETLGASGSQQVCRNQWLQLSTCSSSIRYKEDVAPFVRGVEVLGRLRPVSFTWKGGGARDLGFVAEEVAQVEPLLVTWNERGEVEGVKYDRLTALLVNAVLEQQKRIEELEARYSARP